MQNGKLIHSVDTYGNILSECRMDQTIGIATWIDYILRIIVRKYSLFSRFRSTVSTKPYSFNT